MILHIVVILSGGCGGHIKADSFPGFTILWFRNIWFCDMAWLIASSWQWNGGHETL